MYFSLIDREQLKAALSVLSGRALTGSGSYADRANEESVISDALGMITHCTTPEDIRARAEDVVFDLLERAFSAAHTHDEYE